MAARQPFWGDIFIMPPTMTVDDLLRLPSDDAKIELYEGTVVREEMTGPTHGDISYRLSGELFLYARQAAFRNRILQNSLIDFTPSGATTKTVLAPDIAIMRTSTKPTRAKIPHSVPLMAVEIVSPSQSLSELGLKAQFYRNAGVDEVWLIDDGTRIVEIWNATGILSLTDGQILSSPLLPGFIVDVTYLFDG